MPDQPLPESGEIWIKRKTGERFEVWSSYPRWVIVYPLRDGNRRSVHVITNKLLPGVRARRRRSIELLLRGERSGVSRRFR